MSFVDKLWIKLFCKFVGRDKHGNSYYQKDENGKNRRFVLYTGYAEPTKVPPDWYNWLHHMCDELPYLGSNKTYSWQKGENRVNFTGTKLRYEPKNINQLKPLYQAWKPE